MFDTADTYDSDLPLFAELRLKPFKNIPSRKRHYIGVVRLDQERTVEIYVTPVPAQFFEFDINCDGKRYKVTTGSGCLSDYWPSAKLIAENMLVVEAQP